MAQSARGKRHSLGGCGKKEVEPLAAMKEMGVDAVRFRIFVNPPKDAYWRKDEKTICMLGFCDGQSVLEVSKRVKEAGMKLMLDFHYSDHFADPEYQDIPEEWAQDDAAQLTKGFISIQKML